LLLLPNNFSNPVFIRPPVPLIAFFPYFSNGTPALFSPLPNKTPAGPKNPAKTLLTIPLSILL
jgi:hypothetical protein